MVKLWTLLLVVFFVPIAYGQVVITYDNTVPIHNAGISVTAPFQIGANQSMNVTVSVNNTGESQLTNAQIAIQLPTGWILEQGTLTNALGTINRLEQKTVSVSVLAPIENASFLFPVTFSSSQLTKSSNATVVVSTEGSRDLTIHVNSTFAATKDTPFAFDVIIENKGNITLQNTNITLEGIDSTWYSVNPQTTEYVAKGTKKTFSITLTPTVAGTYQIDLVASAVGIQKSSSHTLVVSESVADNLPVDTPIDETPTENPSSDTQPNMSLNLSNQQNSNATDTRSLSNKVTANLKSLPPQTWMIITIVGVALLILLIVAIIVVRSIKSSTQQTAAWERNGSEQNNESSSEDNTSSMF